VKSRVASLAALAACLAASAAAQSAQATAASCLPDCSGQTLTTPNFSHQDLTNAVFSNATIVGASFIRANLTGAKFDGAKFQSVAGFPTQTPDFTFANLTNASFKGAQFEAPTYLTHTTLTCADFSNTNINNGNAIFGESPLISDAGVTCADGQKSRTKFQGTTMSCEFIDDWKSFDLTGAVVKACLTQLSDRNFSGAILAGVDFTGAVLDGDLFPGANLMHATLIHASLQCRKPGFAPEGCVDLSNASLQGAHLDNANLTSASLYNALLANKNGNMISDSAFLTQAHLKNVNLAGAQLSGVDFTLANFYGSSAANPGGCATTGGNVPSGFTKNCATAQGAIMTGTKFISSYLKGVDFAGAEMAGVNFYQAVLVGARFTANTTIGVNTNDGSVTNFSRAFLQGTNLDAPTTLSGATLANAYLDFTSGNTLFVVLSGADHNQFACSARAPCKPPSGQDVCVEIDVPTTTVPQTNSTITCPDGRPADSSGCGAPPGSQASCPSPGGCTAMERTLASRWRSNLTIGKPPNPGPPPGTYQNDGTFTCGAPDCAICGGKGSNAGLLFW